MVSRMEKRTITKLPEIGDKTYKKQLAWNQTVINN